jgi:signal transduction histidine kinase
MRIKDGKYFEVESILRTKENKQLQERVEMVGGTFCVESACGQGITVQVEIPFTRVRKDTQKIHNLILKYP